MAVLRLSKMLCVEHLEGLRSEVGRWSQCWFLAELTTCRVLCIMLRPVASWSPVSRNAVRGWSFLRDPCVVMLLRGFAHRPCSEALYGLNTVAVEVGGRRRKRCIFQAPRWA